MMEAPPIHHEPNGSSKPAEIDSIPDAFRLHGVLGPDIKTSDGDEFSDSECIFSDTTSEESDTADQEENCNGECNENGTCGALIRVGIKDNFLRRTRTIDSASDKCANSVFRKDMWAVDPKEQLEHLGNHKMGFLSQLAQLCVQFKLYHCDHARCVETRQVMDNCAPDCDWYSFREWALVTMSCQASLDEGRKVSWAHTHLARTAAACSKILKKCLDQKKQYFAPFLDGQGSQEGCSIELTEVFNVIYWMAGIQNQLKTGPAEILKWNHYFLPFKYTVSTVRSAVYNVETLELCKNHLWNFFNVSDRKHVDLPDIMTAIAKHKEYIAHNGHDLCTPAKCQQAQMDSTKVGQLHKCERQNNPEENESKGPAERDLKKFPVELLITNIELGKSTAWLCDTLRLCPGDEAYIAISHVWSDGTGTGNKGDGVVNACLFDFFVKYAKKLGCKALWWDTLSIPSKKNARSKALKGMHGNYANAEHTLVQGKLQNCGSQHKSPRTNTWDISFESDGEQPNRRTEFNFQLYRKHAEQRREHVYQQCNKYKL